MRLAAIIFLVSLLLASSAACQEPLVKQINLTEMTQRAGVVVHATVTGVSPEPHPDYPNVATLRVTLRVLETAVGNAGSRLSFRTYAGSSRFGNRAAKSSRAEYRVGEELVLFLYPNSSSGFTSVVGGNQGRFRVEREGPNLFVVNSLGNRGLFAGVERQATSSGIAINAKQATMLTQPSGRSELAPFLSVVRQLAATKEAR